MKFHAIPARLLPVLFFLCAAGWRLDASPIFTGTITVAGITPVGFFSLTGDGFTVGGTLVSGNWEATRCFPCAAGASLGVNGTLVGLDFYPFGSATIGGDVFPSLNWGNINAAGPSEFQITGTPVTVSGPGLYRAPFSFTGALCGTTSSSSLGSPCVASLPSLTGSGMVEVALKAQPEGLLTLDHATYSFTPEPNLAAALLAAFGLGAVLRRRIRA